MIDKPTLVFLTDFWGPKHGGINTFNFELCTNLGKFFGDRINVVSVVLNAPEGDVQDAEKSNVTLISLNFTSDKLSSDYATEVLRVVSTSGFDQVKYWVGHDVITGEIANKLRRIDENRDSSSIIFHHMDYEAYQIFKHNDAISVKVKIDLQRSILREADNVFAIGPYLTDSAKDICGSDVNTIIPGLQEYHLPKKSPNVFKVITFGRLESDNEIIKQLELAVRSFGMAIRKFGEINQIMSIPKMVVFGLNEKEDQTKRLASIMEQNAGRKVPVVAVPYIEDRAQLLKELQSSSVCMMLSLHEGFGLVGWESIGVGVPIIISKTSGLYRFLWNFGGMATGCFSAVDVTGAPEIDSESVSAFLLEYMLRTEKAKKDISSLRDMLIREGYTWINASNTFLSKLGIDVKKPINIPLTKSPYKFLESYNEFDEDIFYGREKSTLDFIEKALRNNITVLFGKGGVGKTSLIRAGVIPALLRKNVIPIYSQLSSADPIESIRQGIYDWLYRNSKGNKSLSDIKKIFPADLSISQLIDKLDTMETREIVIFIDRFEQLFLAHENDSIDLFEDQFEGVTNIPYLHIHIVIIVREDFFHELDRFDKWDNIYKNRFRLKPLLKAQAKHAIVDPASLFGFQFEDGLPERILDDLISEKEEIFPPQLQIICERLVQKLKFNKKTIEVSDYEKLGGAKQIISDYLDDILENLDSVSQLASKTILKGMVDSRNVSNPLDIDDAQDLLSGLKGWKMKKTVTLIETLIKERLIIKTDSEKPYELAHEYLIFRIREWIDAESYKTQEARDLLKSSFFNWKSQNIPIDEKAFEVINLFRDKLSWDKEKLSFMLSSSIIHNSELLHWGSTAVDKEIGPSAILPLFKHSSFLIAQTAFAVLLKIGAPGFNISMLDNLGKAINPNLIKVIDGINDLNGPVPDKFTKIIREKIEHNAMSNMVMVLPGKFIQGLSDSEIDTLVTNGAPRKFFVDKYEKLEVELESYFIDRYLVTNEEYSSFDSNHTYPIGHNQHPATNINYYMAKKYALWLGKDLPTESEWEKAARGHDGRMFPWGNNWDSSLCNTRLSGISGTTPVGTFPKGQSPFGCLDMSGNVWEWTNSWKKRENTIIVRGGSWSKMNILPWCAYRFDYEAKEGQQNVGFRCVRRINNKELGKVSNVFSSGGVVYKMKKNLPMFLLCHNKKEKEWRLPKGMLEIDEDIEECAIREIKEETGCQVEIVDYLNFATWSYKYEGKMYDEVGIFFLTKLKNDTNTGLDGEFDETKWFSIENALKKISYESERGMLEMAVVKLDISDV